MTKTTTMSREEKLVNIIGKRNLPKNAIIFDEPCELGYHCPVCEYELIKDGNYDERLTWSEYEGFLWCYECKKDYPTCLCEQDKDKAVEIYIQCFQSLLTSRDNEWRERIKGMKEDDTFYAKIIKKCDCGKIVTEYPRELEVRIRNKIINDLLEQMEDK